MPPPFALKWLLLMGHEQTWVEPDAPSLFIHGIPPGMKHEEVLERIYRVIGPACLRYPSKLPDPRSQAHQAYRVCVRDEDAVQWFVRPELWKKKETEGWKVHKYVPRGAPNPGKLARHLGGADGCHPQSLHTGAGMQTNQMQSCNGPSSWAIQRPASAQNKEAAAACPAAVAGPAGHKPSCVQSYWQPKLQHGAPEHAVEMVQAGLLFSMQLSKRFCSISLASLVSFDAQPHVSDCKASLNI